MEQLKELTSRSGISSKRELIAATALFILIHSVAFSVLFVGSWTSSVLPEYVGYPLIYIIFLTIEIVLASSDTLYYGDPTKSRYARAFQEHFPSKHLARKFHLKEREAQHYWFNDIFNVWANPQHPHHDQWKRTISRGYSCRFIYYVIRFLEILLAACVAMILLQTVSSYLIDGRVSLLNVEFFSKYAFTLCVVVLYLVIRLTNRTSRGHLTGVWRRFAEINQLHIEWIDHNIKSTKDLQRTGLS